MPYCKMCHKSKPGEHFARFPDHSATGRKRRLGEGQESMMIAAPTGTRRCSRCQRVLPLTEYWRDTRRPDGLQTRCKACLREIQRRVKHAPADAHALAGVRIHAGHAVTVPAASSASTAADPASEGAPAAPAVPITPRPGTITCRDWIRRASPRRRLFLCEGGRYAVEQLAADMGQSPRFLVWHLASDHKAAENTPCDAAAVLLLLSFIAPGVLDRPGTVYTA